MFSNFIHKNDVFSDSSHVPIKKSDTLRNVASLGDCSSARVKITKSLLEKSFPPSTPCIRSITITLKGRNSTIATGLKASMMQAVVTISPRTCEN